MPIIFPDPTLQSPANTFSPTSTPDATTNGLTYTWDPALQVWISTTGGGGGGATAASLAEAAAGLINTKYLSPETGVPKNAAGMTGAALLPGGDDAARALIASPTAGMIRYNDQTLPATIEYYDGSGWVTMATSGGSGGGVGVYPGVWLSDPVNSATTSPATLWIDGPAVANQNPPVATLSYVLGSGPSAGSTLGNYAGSYKTMDFSGFSFYRRVDNSGGGATVSLSIQDNANIIETVKYPAASLQTQGNVTNVSFTLSLTNKTTTVEGLSLSLTCVGPTSNTLAATVSGSEIVNFSVSNFYTLVSSGPGTITLMFFGMKLNQASVDSILVAVDQGGSAEAPGQAFSVNVSGGTSASPGAAGNAAKTSLQGKGWTVTTN